MAYDTKVLFDKAKEQIKERRLIFIEEVVAFIGINKTTFYDHFPINSNEINELKKLIEDNKIDMKTRMRNKWYKSDNPTLQMGLMKLISTPEEHKRLSQTFVDTNDVTEAQKTITIKYKRSEDTQ